MRFARFSFALLAVLALTSAAAYADPAYFTVNGTLATTAYSFSGPPDYNAVGTFSAVYGSTATPGAQLMFNGTTLDLDIVTSDDSGVYFSDNSGDEFELLYFQGLGLSTSPFCTDANCPGAASALYQGPFSDISVLDASQSATIVPMAATPEPSGLMLLGTGVLGVCGLVRRRFRA